MMFMPIFLLLLRLQVVNSVVMNHVTIGDSCSIQGSIICSNVQLQERAVLKDCQVIYFIFFWVFFMVTIWIGTWHCLCCQVGAGFVVAAGSECKGDVLAKKWNWDIIIQAREIHSKLTFILLQYSLEQILRILLAVQFGGLGRSKEILIFPICISVLCIFILSQVLKWLQSLLSIHLCKWLPLFPSHQKFSSFEMNVTGDVRWVSYCCSKVVWSSTSTFLYLDKFSTMGLFFSFNSPPPFSF